MGLGNEGKRKKTSCAAVGYFLTFGAFCSFFYCMLAADALVKQPLTGGALYLIAFFILLIGKLIRTGGMRLLSWSVRVIFTALPAALAFYAGTVMRPAAADGAFERLAAIALCAALRRYIAPKKEKTARLAAAGAHALLVAAAAGLLLSSSLPRGAAWALAGGFAVSGLPAILFPEKPWPRLAPLTEADKREIAALRGAHAVKMYQALLLTVAAALPAAQAMGYAYFAVMHAGLISRLIAALLCGWTAGLAALALLNRKKAEGADPNALLAAGLTVWLSGTILFIRAMKAALPAVACPALALCTSGAVLCGQAVVRLQDDIRRAMDFALGRAPGAAADAVLRTRFACASLTGQTVALAGLTAMAVLTKRAGGFSGDWEEAMRSFGGALTLPALALVIAACFFALLFPLNREHLSKLKKYIALRGAGEENAPLRGQLEAAIVKKSVKNYGIKAIIFTLRLCYHYRVRGAESLKLDEDIPCVFVCNHGEINGPVVTKLFVPFPFRPWSTYEMLDRDVVADRCMNGTFEKVSGVRRKILGFFMEKLAASALVWIMRSVGCIPVYHDQPRKLMQTFRETVAAMEAGDNILLFPENSANTEDHKYVKEGISEFFTGFTMIGQMYAGRTGKCPLFVPLYADRRKRTITFGTPTRYNVDVSPNDEKERLCRDLRAEILRLAGIDAPQAAGE